MDAARSHIASGCLAALVFTSARWCNQRLSLLFSWEVIVPVEWSKQAQELLAKHISIEARRLRDLGALVADRIDQDPGDISIDLATGEIVGALSDAARAARLAIAHRIILKGGEDPGWGR